MKLIEIKNFLQENGIETSESQIENVLRKAKLNPGEVSKNILSLMLDDFRSGITPVDAGAKTLAVQKETDPDRKPAKSESGLTIGDKSVPAVSSVVSTEEIDILIQDLEPEAEKGDDALIAYVCSLYDRRKEIVEERRQMLVAIRRGVEQGQQQLDQGLLAELEGIVNIPLQSEQQFQNLLTQLGVKTEETFRRLSNQRSEKFAAVAKRFT